MVILFSLLWIISLSYAILFIYLFGGKEGSQLSPSPSRDIKSGPAMLTWHFLQNIFSKTVNVQHVFLKDPTRGEFVAVIQVLPGQAKSKIPAQIAPPQLPNP